MDRPLVTFLSDFGLYDAYTAQVKAVILSAVPDARIVDITHEVPSYSILQAAWLLHTSYRYFPVGAVHLCVVDPGVGTPRPALAVRKGGHIFVGPDNGVFSFLYPADAIIEVRWRPSTAVSPTFHGRDFFAPLVAEVMRGTPLETLGSPADRPVSFDVSRDMVAHIDRFGTVITTIPASKLKDGCSVQVGEMRVGTIAPTFAGIPEGGLALLHGSASTIEIAADRASAAAMLGARVGQEVVFYPGLERE